LRYCRNLGIRSASVVDERTGSPRGARDSAPWLRPFILALYLWLSRGMDDVRSAAIQKIALRCKTDLYYLAKHILNYGKMEPHAHQELCDYTTSILPNVPAEVYERIQAKHEDFDPRKNLLLLLMPRGSFKSSVVTVAFSLQMILNEPNIRIMIDSETFSKSKAFLREIIEHLESNEAYREVFKAIHGMYPFTTRSAARLWTDSEVILPCRTRPLKEPTICCAGIDVTKNGMHYDLIIADDLHSEKNVTNREQIQQTIDHYKLAFSLLDPGKPMIVIGTRWHELDLYQHIMDYEAEDFNILKKSAYNDDGSLFFPEVLTAKELDKIRRRQGVSIFSKQYLNEPVSDENATFKREYIVRKPWEEVKGRPMNWYLSVDPSYYDPRGTTQYGDYATFVLVGMDYKRELFVRHIVRKKMPYSEIINTIFDIYTDPRFADTRSGRTKDMKIILEVVGSKSLSYELSNAQRERNTWLPITEIKSRKLDKHERIRGLAPFYEYGHVYHIKECPEIEELEYELLHFPSGKHDDIIDALATVLEFASPPTYKQVVPPEDRPSKKRLWSLKPRSAVTKV
jgi:predicted phage terminase large subunit-like protein